MRSDPTYGVTVTIPWGLSKVHGTVVEVYGPKSRRHVVVELTPELSDFVVAERTTVSLPREEVELAPISA